MYHSFPTLATISPFKIVSWWYSKLQGIFQEFKELPDVLCGAVVTSISSVFVPEKFPLSIPSPLRMRMRCSTTTRPW